MERRIEERRIEERRQDGDDMILPAAGLPKGGRPTKDMI